MLGWRCGCHTPDGVVIRQGSLWCAREVVDNLSPTVLTYTTIIITPPLALVQVAMSGTMVCGLTTTGDVVCTDSSLNKAGPFTEVGWSIHLTGC